LALQDLHDFLDFHVREAIEIFLKAADFTDQERDVLTRAINSHLGDLSQAAYLFAKNPEGKELVAVAESLKSQIPGIKLSLRKESLALSLEQAQKLADALVEKKEYTKSLDEAQTKFINDLAEFRREFGLLTPATQDLILKKLENFGGPRSRAQFKTGYNRLSKLMRGFKKA